MMPGILALFGLLAAVFVGGGSSGATTTASEATTPDDTDTEMPDGGMSGGDMPDGDMSGGDMSGGHGDHGAGGMPGMGGDFVDITAFGVFHGTSSHTMGHSLEGGRTPITTEAIESYNGLRAFLGLEAASLEDVGRWAFENDMTNNDEAYGQDHQGVGLFYGMQGAKVGWIRDDVFDPQLLADLQRTARQGDPDEVMQMVEEFGLDGYAGYLESQGLVETFINTMKMEPHYGGWMHGRTHGDLVFDDETGAPVATAHDLNHLTVLSHDQTQPFMNDTFDWPQWPALNAPEADVADYFQSMVTLGDPQGEGIEADMLSGSETMAFVSGGAILMIALGAGVSGEELMPMGMADEDEEELVLL